MVDALVDALVGALGRVAAADFSMELDNEHCSEILAAVKEGGVIKRTSVDDVLGMFA